MFDISLQTLQLIHVIFILFLDVNSSNRHIALSDIRVKDEIIELSDDDEHRPKRYWSQRGWITIVVFVVFVFA